MACGRKNGADAVAQYRHNTDYLADCAQRDIAPEKPASGKLMLRVAPEVHAAVSIAVQAASKSINEWAAEALSKAAQL